MASARVGILTGGGDVPGLNAVIKSVVYRGSEHGVEVVGIRRGWEGLTHLDVSDPASRSRYVLPLTRENTRTVDRTGGTFLQYDLSQHVLSNLAALGIDHLIAIGGDDTLSFAARLHQLGGKVIAIPKTMDNDVRGTEYCIGFSTAITRAIDAIQRQRTTVGSHERIGVFRVFGRDAGFTALYTAFVTSIRCVIPEHKPKLEKLIDLLITDKRSNPSNYALVVLSEGAEWEGYQVQEYGEPDAYGHRKKASVAESLSDEIKRRTGEETIVSDLTYDLRSGDPDFIDKLVALTFGAMALDAVVDGQSGLMSALVNGRYDLVPIPDPKLGPRKVDVATMYNTERYRPIYEGKRGMPIFLNRA